MRLSMVSFSSSSAQNGGLSSSTAGYDAEYWFGFNGMETDDEVKGNGNSLDFGARIYDPRIGRWLSTDPLQVKFPDVSPYNFVLNSPLIVIDPDGKEIKIVTKDPEFRGYILNQLQKLTDDELTIDAAGVVQIVHSARNPTKSSGTSLISQLVGSENGHFILESTNGDNHSQPLFGSGEATSNGTGAGTTIMIDPSNAVMVTDQDGVERAAPDQIVVGHELIHSSHMDKGELDSELADPAGDNYPTKVSSGIPLTKEEITTRGEENVLRKEQGVTPLRKVSGPNKSTQLPEVKISPKDD
jgi:RHS repeat-associated protein